MAPPSKILKTFHEVSILCVGELLMTTLYSHATINSPHFNGALDFCKHMFINLIMTQFFFGKMN